MIASTVAKMPDPHAFRRALGRFATGVVLVTADVAGEPTGLVVNSLAAVSLVPPLIAFCPARASLTWARMRGGRRFGVNVLAHADADYARAAAARGADRFAGVEHHRSAHGVPVLARAVAFLECTVETEHPAGDHWLVLGRVSALEATPAEAPLVFCDGAFGTFTPTLEEPDVH